jgi:Lrp/AsnC family leucine-responsive transcriptional regulator
LDDIDRDIIRQLSADGRASLTDIGEVCGISRISVRKRIERMEDAGVIKGFTVVVDWDLVVTEE